MFTLRRCFLSLSLAYMIVITLCLPPSTFPAAASNPARINRRSSVRLNSPRRIRVPVQNTTRSSRRDGELLIRFRRSASLTEQNSVAASIGAREFRVLRGTSRVVRVVLGRSQTIESAALALQNQPLVEAVEPNYVIYQDNVSKPKSAAKLLPSAQFQQPGIPNDPRFTEQWPLRNLGGNARLFGSDIQVTSIWSHNTGQRELRIAVIDSGIDFTHPDLKNQQWKNQKETRDGKDQDRNGYIDDISGWNFVKDNQNVADENGHGTNIAGIVAAEGNNGIGIAG